jgi:hypothetical protein
MPGVEKSNVSVGVENGVLNVEGRLDLSSTSAFGGAAEVHGPTAGGRESAVRAAFIQMRDSSISLSRTSE